MGRAAASGKANPGGPHGIEKAKKTPGAPPRRPRPAAGAGDGRLTGGPKPKTPIFPPGTVIELPKTVIRELRSYLKDREADDVAKALTVGSSLIDEGDGAAAIPFLVFAKDSAPRSVTVRETLGVAHYHAEQYAEALRELQTYRRLSGKLDQNHIIADCQRALGRPTAHIGETVQEMDPEDVGRDRYVEGIIVWGCAVADGGDIAAGRAILRRLLDQGQPPKPADEDLRLWYVAGDLAERDGDQEAARRWFGLIRENMPGFHDVDERLADL